MADKELQSIMEAFYNAAPYGNPEQQESEDKESVSYSKTKRQGDASVTVSANADSMEELHNILKLAGIEIGDKEEHDHEEHDHEDICDGCGKPGDECECEDCDQHGSEEGGEDGGPVVVSLKPQGYNPVAGDKKEILNALMNRYKSL